MRIDNCLLSDRLGEIPSRSRAAENAGFDGLWTLENAHDVFLRLALAAEHTERVDLVTAIAVAFARNPMTVAIKAWDLQELSGGRFILGLGAQVKAHVERRYSMPWSTPAPRMREFVHAVRAIWECWENGTPLDFRGEHYTHTLMTPVFDPGPNPYGNASIFLAGVGPVMIAVAGEVGDGWISHPYSTERYLKEVSIPAVEKGLARAGRRRDEFQISCPVMVVTGRDEREMTAMRARVRADIAFHASTYAYRPVLDLYGWEDLQTELHGLVKGGRWDEMAALVDDEVLRTFAVVGEPGEIPALVRKRFEGVADRISFYPPDFNDPELWAPMLSDLQSIPTGREAAAHA